MAVAQLLSPMALRLRLPILMVLLLVAAILVSCVLLDWNNRNPLKVQLVDFSQTPEGDFRCTARVQNASKFSVRYLGGEIMAQPRSAMSLTAKLDSGLYAPWIEGGEMLDFPMLFLGKGDVDPTSHAFQWDYSYDTRSRATYRDAITSLVEHIPEGFFRRLPRPPWIDAKDQPVEVDE